MRMRRRLLYDLWDCVSCGVDEKGVGGKSNRTVAEIYALVLQIRFDWEDDRVKLVVWCTVYPRQGIDSRELLDEAVQIALEFYSTVPRLKSKSARVSLAQNSSLSRCSKGCLGKGKRT